jgi:hypothetical protein
MGRPAAEIATLARVRLVAATDIIPDTAIDLVGEIGRQVSARCSETARPTTRDGCAVAGRA